MRCTTVVLLHKFSRKVLERLRPARAGLTVCTILALAACGSQPVQTERPSNATFEPTAEDASSLLARADSASASEALFWYLQAYAAALAESELDLARVASTKIDSTIASPLQRTELALLDTELLIREENWDLALGLLQQQTADDAPRWFRLSGEIQQGLGHSVAAALDFHQCALQSASNNLATASFCEDRRWQALQSATPPELSRLTSQPDRDLAGWAELAFIVNNNSGAIENQTRALDRWLTENSRLGTGQNIPEEALRLMLVEFDFPQRVALLLPLSGRLQEAGQAVLDGFMAAHYETLQLRLPVPDLSVFDTATTTAELLAANITAGSFDLVVGPLDGTMVTDLLQALPPQIPVLALNRVPPDTNSENRHIGLSLAVESEAVQAAHKALDLGFQDSLILLQDTAYGDRAAQEYSRVWSDAHARLTGLVRLRDATSLTASLEQAFHIDQSQQRRQQLQTLLGKRLEFSPRRRQDIDNIFLASNAVFARQVGPTMAFVFAEDVPVLSVSRVFEKSTDAEAYRDLADLFFLAPPWLIEDGNAIAGVASTRAAELQELEAMGLDAFYIGRRFTQLETGEILYKGRSGSYQVGEDANLVRTMEWAQINGLSAQPAEFR